MIKCFPMAHIRTNEKGVCWLGGPPRRPGRANIVHTTRGGWCVASPGVAPTPSPTRPRTPTPPTTRGCRQRRNLPRRRLCRPGHPGDVVPRATNTNRKMIDVGTGCRIRFRETRLAPRISRRTGCPFQHGFLELGYQTVPAGPGPNEHPFANISSEQIVLPTGCGS